MSNSKVVTLRMPVELKKRLEREAKYQGTSINQLTNYLLNIQLTQIESFSALESKLSKKSIPELKVRVKNILTKISDRPVPKWDELT